MGSGASCAEPPGADLRRPPRQAGEAVGSAPRRARARSLVAAAGGGAVGAGAVGGVLGIARIAASILWAGACRTSCCAPLPRIARTAPRRPEARSLSCGAWRCGCAPAAAAAGCGTCHASSGARVAPPWHAGQMAGPSGPTGTAQRRLSGATHEDHGIGFPGNAISGLAPWLRPMLAAA